MEELIRVVLALGGAELADEAAACDFFVRARWPNGLRCPHCDAACTRDGAHAICAGTGRHAFTVFVNTALHWKRKPNVRAMILAVRAMALSHRSISARELARV